MSSALLALWLLATGCSKSSSPPDEDASVDETDASVDASEDARRDGGSDARVDAPIDPDTDILPIVVGVPDGDGGVDPFEEGEDATLIWGPQGGIMITPTIRLATSDGWQAERTYVITIVHSAAPGHEESFGVAEVYRSLVLNLMPEPQEGFLEMSGLFNPLSEEPLHDTWTHLDVTVSADGVRGTASVSLHLIDPTEIGACATFPIRDDTSGCRSREIPTTLHVVDLELSGESTIVHYTLEVSDVAAECEPLLANGTERTNYQPAACVEDWIVGEDRPALSLKSGRCGTWDEIVTGCP